MSQCAIAYYRVSTQRQGRSGLGIEAQRNAVARFAEAEGLTILEEFTEVETGKGSDALDRRPHLAQALAAARSQVRGHRRQAGSALARCRLHLRPDGTASAVHRCRAWSRCRSLHAPPLCGAGRERAPVDLGADQGSAVWPKDGTKLGNPTNAAAAAARGREISVRGADQFAEAILPTIQSIRSSGTTSLRGIAITLNDRGIRTARGGQWQVSNVRNLLARRADPRDGTAL